MFSSAGGLLMVKQAFLMRIPFGSGIKGTRSTFVYPACVHFYYSSSGEFIY